jgi:Uncharacterised nucleotidyltransferase
MAFRDHLAMPDGDGARAEVDRAGAAPARPVTSVQARVAHALSQEAALAKIVPRLRALDIRPLLIKGPVTARLLYDDPDERISADIDLLVSPDRFEDAAAVLRDLGFRKRYAEARPSEQTEHADEWTLAGQLPVAVDLHRSLFLVTDPLRAHAVLSRHTTVITCGTVPIDAPDEAGSALILALHAAQHLGQTSRPQDDLRRAVARLPAATWSAASERADELGVSPAFALGLRTVPEGEALAAALALDKPPAEGTRLRIAGAFRDAPRLVDALRGRDRGAFGSSLRDAIFPSRAFMHAKYPQTVGSLPRLLLAYPARLRRAPGAIVQIIRILADRSSET